jgi:hypothetical protein
MEVPATTFIGNSPLCTPHKVTNVVVRTPSVLYGTEVHQAHVPQQSIYQYITKAAATESVDPCLAPPLRCRYRWPPLVKKGVAIEDTYRGPLGAQYCPVMLISNFSINSTSDLAATSGVTATVIISYLPSRGRKAATYHLRHPSTCRIPPLWSSRSS